MGNQWLLEKEGEDILLAVVRKGECASYTTPYLCGPGVIVWQPLPEDDCQKKLQLWLIDPF